MSKAEEEADRLVDVFSIDYSNHYNATNKSIELALIHVEGIIDELNRMIGFYEDNGMVDSDLSCQPIAHWQEVKQELKKM